MNKHLSRIAGFLLGAALVLVPLIAKAQQQPFSPTGGVAVSVTNSSNPTPFPSPGPTALIENVGANGAYIWPGGSGVTVSATNAFIYVAPGCSAVLFISGYTNLAAITAAAGGTSLALITGSGTPIVAPTNCGSAGGGAGAGLPPASARWQAIIAVTGTAVQLQSASFVLTGWVHFCADPGNSGPLFFGNSSVTNTGSGTGNGTSILPGACDNLPATQVMTNLNQFYMNGPIGAWASGYAY